jgi:hypothetical protein
MTAKNNLYWGATCLVCVAFSMGGAVDALRLPPAVRVMTHLGYPEYVMTILGVWKLLAVPVLLVRGFGLVKEWAYAGLVIDVTGAIASHAFVGDGPGDIAPPAFVLALLVTSWALRPLERRVQRATREAAGTAPGGEAPSL